MKTEMIINVEKDLKKKLLSLAKEKWVSPDDFINSLLQKAVNKKWFTPKTRMMIDFEIEPFSEEEIKSLMDNKSIQKNYNELSRLLAKV